MKIILMEDVPALLGGLREVLAGRAVGHPTVHAGGAEMREQALEGVEVDLAVRAEGRDERGKDALELHGLSSLI